MLRGSECITFCIKFLTNTRTHIFVHYFMKGRLYFIFLFMYAIWLHVFFCIFITQQTNQHVKKSQGKLAIVQCFFEHLDLILYLELLFQ